MTARDAIIRELVAKVEKARAYVKSIERSIAWCKQYQMGRGAADDRVALYYAESDLEGAMQDLGDELYAEALAMDLELAA